MNVKLLGIITLLFSSFILSAQDEEQEFTDEELSKYATVMVWAELEKGRMADSVEYWVKNNDTLSAATYNELSKASKAGDISSVDATEDEVAVFMKIQENIEGQKEEFKEVYIGRIKDDIGAGLYNKLNKALKSDEELNDRYMVIYETMLAAKKPAEEDEEDASDGDDQ